MSTPKIEVLVVRHPDSGTSLELWVDGVASDAWSVEHVDPGSGHERSAWEEQTEEVGEIEGYSEAFRSAVVSAREDWNDSEFVVEDRVPLTLLVGVDVEDVETLKERTKDVLDRLRMGVWDSDGCGWETWSEPVEEDANDGRTLVVWLDEVYSQKDADQVIAAAGDILKLPKRDPERPTLAVLTNSDEYMEPPAYLRLATGEWVETEYSVRAREQGTFS